MIPPKPPLATPVLIELLEHICGPYGSRGMYHLAPPTPGSVKRINGELSVALPPLFVEVATACPSYGGWFAGIGDDYDNPLHILPLNAAFRAAGLPPRYVMFNHGHDGDCDCWDLESPAGPNAERPLVYCHVGDDGRLTRPPQPRPGSFRDYLESFCRSHVSSIRQPGVRRRMKRLLADHDGGDQLMVT